MSQRSQHVARRLPPEAEPLSGIDRKCCDGQSSGSEMTGCPRNEGVMDGPSRVATPRETSRLMSPSREDPLRRDESPNMRKYRVSLLGWSPWFGRFAACPAPERLYLFCRKADKAVSERRGRVPGVPFQGSTTLGPHHAVLVD